MTKDNKCNTIIDLLRTSRQVTQNYIDRGHTWTDNNESKIKEEDKEFLEAISRENKIEEFWDKFWSSLTGLHLEGITDYEIYSTMELKLDEIIRRSLGKPRINIIGRK